MAFPSWSSLICQTCNKQRRVVRRQYSRLQLSRPHLFQITTYLEVKIWSLVKNENLTTGKKYCGKGISLTSGVKLNIHPGFALGIFFSFATIFANLIFFVPFSLTLSQILSQILAIFRQRIILSEKGVHLLIPISAAVDS